MAMLNTEQNTARPLANFPPTVWGSNFASLSISNQEIELYDKKVDILKEKVKDMLMASTENLIKNIELINLLYRLGVSYHFETEIDEQLDIIFNGVQIDIQNNYDIYTTALLFQVLRQHGYKMSCSVFEKFKDNEGKFKKGITKDVKGILSLYEATFVGMHGEDILDEALAFAKPQLERMAMESSPHLAKHIKNALSLPFHRGLPRLEARKYISLYEEDESHDETLLKFAKLDFNRLQLIYKQELGTVSRWWKELNLTETCPYARDRIVEGYFIGVGVQFEPQFALSRMLLGKSIAFVAVFDDTYDAYGTYEEVESFTDALERSNIDAIDQLPADYLKTLYKEALILFDDWVNDDRKEGGSYCHNYTKDRFKELARSYLLEAKWNYDRYLPSFEEYMRNALTSCTFALLSAIVAIGMGKLAGTKEFQWLESNPRIVHASKFFGRLINDIVARKDEQNELAAGECYMKEYGVSRENAIKELRKMCDNAWKDMNEECMKPTPVPMPLLMTNVNLARVMEVVYQYRDSFTDASNLQDYINLVLLKPVPE